MGPGTFAPEFGAPGTFAPEFGGPGTFAPEFGDPGTFAPEFGARLEPRIFCELKMVREEQFQEMLKASN